jgi:hypothetical protein
MKQSLGQLSKKATDTSNSLSELLTRYKNLCSFQEVHQSAPIFNIFARILLTAILLASMAVVLPIVPARADDAGWALYFDDPTEWVHLDATADIIGSGWETTKSVNLWVKPSSGKTCTYSDAASCEIIFGDLPQWWGISIGRIPYGHHANQDCIWVWNYDVHEALICIPYTQGEWVNIALVHSGGMLRAFKNGTERGSVASGATYQIQGQPSDLYLGGIIYNPNRVQVFSGMVDEVSIWNRALTATEIRQNMFNSLTSPQVGLRAYYKMSDGPASLTLTDDSANGWNGTLLDGKSEAGCSGDGDYAHWVTSDAFVAPDEPVAPTGLTATTVSTTQINLSWTDNSDNETDFEIQRCTGSGCSDFSPLTYIPPGAGTGSLTDYFDTRVSPGTEYCYQVRVINACGSSAFTNIACDTTWRAYFLPDLMKNYGP